MSDQCKECESDDNIIKYKDEQIEGLLRTIHTLSESNKNLAEAYKELSKKLLVSSQSSEANEELEEPLLRHTPDPPYSSWYSRTAEKIPFQKPQFSGVKQRPKTVGKRTPGSLKNWARKKPKESATKKDPGTLSINGQQCVACRLYQQSRNIKKTFFIETQQRVRMTLLDQTCYSEKTETLAYSYTSGN